MKELVLKHKGVLKFLAVFTTSYIALYLLYVLFLKLSTTPDVFTKLVAKQTVYILNQLNYSTTTKISTTYNYISLHINNRLIAGVAEGCNAISIMVLFIAFIVAFAKSVKKTLIFCLLGLLIIHIINVLRIVILVISMYKYPEYSEHLHGIVFPGIIYSSVFFLWMLWIKSFQKTTKNA
jgi:exosortase family protein XrtF